MPNKYQSRALEYYFIEQANLKRLDVLYDSLKKRLLDDPKEEYLVILVPTTHAQQVSKSGFSYVLKYYGTRSFAKPLDDWSPEGERFRRPEKLKLTLIRAVDVKRKSLSVYEED